MINTPKGRIGASVCIVDFTINQGPVRVLPLLTVSEASMNLGSALTLKDVDCLNVIPMTRTRGEDIVAHYEAIFEKTGYPSAFLQDGGGNLKSAVTELNQKRASKNLDSIPIIFDIGHFSANVIKRRFDKEAYIQELLDIVTQFNLKVRLTAYSFLMGPKSRTAGRYMGYMKQVLRWLYRLQKLTVGGGHPIEGSLRQFILTIFPDLHKMLSRLETFAVVIEIEEFLLIRLKNLGLNSSTRASIKKKLDQLPADHFYRVEMLQWLEQTWAIHKKIGITGSLCVSSDIIETANGIWKQITQRMALNEATHLVLAFATFFGTPATEEQIEQIITRTPLTEVQQWSATTLPVSQRKLKNFDFNGDTLMSAID